MTLLALARISHRFSAATADLAALTGVLAARTHRRMDNTSRGLAAVSARHDSHLRGLATNPGEKSGLVGIEGPEQELPIGSAVAQGQAERAAEPALSSMAEDLHAEGQPHIVRSARRPLRFERR